MKDQKMETDQEVNARVEALLARTLTPHPPPENLRRQVRRRVAAEWEQRPLTLRERLAGLLKMPPRQRAWASVAALAVVAVVAALAAPSSGVPIAGTVVGKAETVAAALAVVAVVAVVGWLLYKHRH